MQVRLIDIPLFNTTFSFTFTMFVYVSSDLALWGMNVTHQNWIYNVVDVMWTTHPKDTKHYACYHKTLK